MNKLIVRIKGGLGNQLFSYAAARRLAHINNLTIVIDDKSGFSRDFEYERQYRLDGFKIPFSLANRSERLQPFERIRRALLKVISRFQDHSKRIYLEQEFPDFDARILALRVKNKTTYIDGLWQSLLYFKDVEDLIRSDLEICEKMSSKNIEAKNWILKNNAISIHVRYFSKTNAGITADNVSVKYYKEAIDIFLSRDKNSNFVIFSDNPKWAEEKLGLSPKNSLFIDWNIEERGEISDLWLMTHAKHYIISNSTFSWWGAWLGSANRGKEVFFPRSNMNWAWDYIGQMPDQWKAILNE